MRDIALVFFCFLSSLSFAQEIGARYLIITHDNFYDAILPYAQWKHKMGYKTKIVRVPSELAQNSTAIRNYIVNAYNTWQIRPEFILFVGAPNYIPWSLSSYPYGDNNYTNMDGDIYNEILSGRLTVHNTTEAQTVVAKMLRYERYPDLMDSTWFKKGCLIVRDVQDDDSVTYRLDAQYVAGLMVNNGYIKVDTFFASRGANATSVINATNEGRGFVLYRGSATNNWYSPFAVNPDNLANGNKLPIVISATCGTLGTGSTSTTAERWFLTGTPTNLRGAAGYFATTTSITNGAYLRSAVARGFFDGVFLYKRRTFGEACEDGRLRVYNTYGATNEYYGFTTIGDPAMTIWTGVPEFTSVTYDSILYAGFEETLQVSVQYQGVPVESAYVCIMFDTLIYQTGWTNSSGSVSFIFNAPNPGIMDITVTGRNLYPFEGTASIIAGYGYVGYQGYILNDSLGNNNGAINPGETILLKVLLKNLGVGTAQDVCAILRTNDTLVVISDSISYYGNIGPGATQIGLNPFVFSVHPRIYAHLIPFELMIKDLNDSTWTAEFSIMTTGASGGNNGTGPDPYGYYIYDDTDTLTGNAPTYNWFEIATPGGGPGQIIPEITNDDADTVTLPLPFTFKFYGINYNTIGICSNGFVEIGGATYPYSYNDPIPTVGRAKRYASPFWDDLNPSQQQMGHGDIYRYYDPVNHLFYVEFYQVALGYGGGGQWETFQIILRDPAYYPTPTGDGEILFMYHTVVNPNSCTIGIEDETETRGLQYLFNGNYSPNTAPIVNGRALLITTKPPISQHSPWLNLLNYTINDSAGGNNNGIPEPDEIIEITLYVKNNGDTIVTNVNGTIRENSESISLIDSVGNFGDLEVGGTGNNATDPYIVQIASIPNDTFVGLTVNFTGNDNNYQGYAYFNLHIHNEIGIIESSSPESDLNLLQIYPNPFQNYLVIRFQIPKNGTGSIMVYDATGRLVRHLYDESTSQQAGMRKRDKIIWYGDDDLGRHLPQGVYFIALNLNGFSTVKKAVILR
uniref:T9SS type A sorting domain-containing protein n=1 Tax=candidate division WOR-3 bacterium TaxID=2052148 RepID=A0A7C4TE06_UNCW3